MMNVSEALIEIRNKINDRDEVGLANEEILAYFNEAIQYISQFLAAVNSPVLLQDLTISSAAGVTLPENYIKMAGIFPVKVTGRTAKPIGTPPITIRIFVGFGRADMNEDVPLANEALVRVAIRLAAVYANNQQELDITQDKALLSDLQNAILLAVGGAAQQPQQQQQG